MVSLITVIIPVFNVEKYLAKCLDSVCAQIGAGAIVVKSIEEADTTWAGVPAKKINNRGTIEVPALEIK